MYEFTYSAYQKVATSDFEKMGPGRGREEMRSESSEVGKLRFCPRAGTSYSLGAPVEGWQCTRK